ncbi:MAG TPA: hypothetical protein DCQ97_05125 [Chitinophagaceae bacterium]|nr:hypothetical protein [Chitinophagaceae bacterium]
MPGQLNEKKRVDKNNKARRLTARLCYIDGLVSTGNQIPYTILKRNFSNRKKNPKYFINIFFWPVDKEAFSTHVSCTKTFRSITTMSTNLFDQQF